jgi:hypothetical protein
LQTDISLSTLESEYSALSQTLRTVIPLRRLLIEVTNALGLDETLCATIHCRAFQDNQSSFLLANHHRLTNRTRYYAVKMHHFWAAVKEKTVEICKETTELMRADYQTKGLVRAIFEQQRKMTQGW